MNRCKTRAAYDTCLQAIVRNESYSAVRRSDPAMAGQRSRWVFFNSLLILRDADHHFAAGAMAAHMRDSFAHGICFKRHFTFNRRFNTVIKNQLF